MALQALYIKHLVTLSVLIKCDAACSRDLGKGDRYFEYSMLHAKISWTGSFSFH